MTIYIISLIVLIAVLLYLRRKITEISFAFEKRMDAIKNFIMQPGFVVTTLGRLLIIRLVAQLARIFKR